MPAFKEFRRLANHVSVTAERMNFSRQFIARRGSLVNAPVALQANVPDLFAERQVKAFFALR